METNKSVNREEKQQSLGIRSQAVNEILGLVPHWMIRWGNSLILILVLGVLAMSYFIKYPDSVSIQVSITTSPPPVNIISEITGDLQEILISDQEVVKKNQLLATIRDVNGHSHQIKSTMEGKIYFHRFWNANMAMEKNDSIFMIAPKKFENYTGRTKVLSQNNNAIYVGQKVRLDAVKGFLDGQSAYEGYVSNVSNIVDSEGNLEVEISIDKESMEVSNDEKIAFKPGMTFHGQIILQDLNLLERIFSQFSNIIKE